MTTKNVSEKDLEKLDRWREVKYSLRMLKRNPLFVTGTVLISIFVLLAIFAPVLAPYDKNDINSGLIKMPPLTPDNRVTETWFTNEIIGTEVVQSSVIQIVDLDNNDQLDMVLGTQRGTLRAYKDFYQGIEAFTLDISSDLKFANGTVIDVGDNAVPTFFDINNDEKVDMLVGNKAGEIWLFQESGGLDADGIPTWTGSIQPEFEIDSYAYPVFNDYDLNNITDLIIGNGNGTIQFYENIGTESIPNFISNQMPFENIIWGSNYNSTHNPMIGKQLTIGIGKIDISDEKLDLIVVTEDGETIFFTNAHRKFTSTTSYVRITIGDESLELPPFPVGQAYTGITFFDINEDGADDLFTGVIAGNVDFYYRTLEENFPIHFFGTDDLGRDVFSRCLYALQIDLIYSIYIVFIAMLIGAVLGALAGYFGGILDTLIMRGTDIMFAFPTIILAIAIASVLGKDLFNLSLALIVVWWTGYTRLVRGQILVEKEKPYVEAARALGYSNTRILFRHILPNAWYPLLVNVTLDLGAVILSFAGLSFIGFGAGPGEAEIGRMISDGRNYFLNQPWMTFFPGLFIFIIVMGWNLVGDGLRDILDPQLRR